MEYKLKRIATASLIFDVSGSKEIEVDYTNNHTLQLDPKQLAAAFPTHRQRAEFLRHLDQAVRSTLDEIRNRIRNNF